MDERMNETKKRGKVPGIILLVLGTLCVLGAIAMVFLADHFEVLEREEPVDVYYATETDEYSYALVQYMSESVAYFNAMENMQFYIVLDNEWNPAVICLHTDELETYQPYIDWLYCDEEEGGPEQTAMTGYAQPFDAELQEWVIEGFNTLFGEEIVDEENFEEWFGSYYLQVGQKNSAYTISKAGIYVFLVALILLVIGGVLVYEKPVLAETNVTGPVIENNHVFLGIIGALLGAALGGLAWTIIGALGYIIGWLGIFIVFLTYAGYTMLARKTDTVGLVISIVFSIIVIVPATYLVYGWSYYCLVNESVSGYVTLTRALAELPVYMTTYDIWSDFGLDLLKGYGFMLIATIYYIASSIFNNAKK